MFWMLGIIALLTVVVAVMSANYSHSQGAPRRVIVSEFVGTLIGGTIVLLLVWAFLALISWIISI